jgi:hypothetical protein
VATELNRRTKLRLCCLLACDTAWVSDDLPFDRSVVGSVLTRSDIPFVLGSQTPFSMQAAQQFLVGMVESLQNKDPLDFAITQGRLAVHAFSPTPNNYACLDWWVPAFYTKSIYFQVLPEEMPIAIPLAT